MADRFDFAPLLSGDAQRRAAPGRLVSASDAPADVVADLVVGQPAPEALPLQAMVEAAQTSLPDNPAALLYGRRQGHLELVDAVREKLRVFEGLDVDRDQILITNGSSQALDMVLRAFVDRGQLVALDEASFGALFVHRVTDRGAHVPWDAQGPRADDLARLFETERPALFYTIPTFQNPMGATTSLARRRELLDLCRRHQVPVLEDDAYYELHYDGERPPSLYELDGGTGLVVRAGTFSKILGAGIRLGWILTAAPLAERILPLKPDGGTSPFSSTLAAAFMRRHMREQMTRLCAIYGARRDLMLETLDEHVGARARWSRPNGGFFVWLTLQRPELAAEVIDRCRRNRVLVRGGAEFRMDGNDLGAIRLAFSHAPTADIQAGVEVLGRAIAAAAAANP